MTSEAVVDASERAPLHPAIHLAPQRGWMNDPNGLCYANGLWHAFYQHDPTTDVHGTMHWGHAISGDLVRWTEQPIALAPDDLGVIFSGSVVIDNDNTAGFGAGAMVAIFTHHRPGNQCQSLAYSVDNGSTWIKYADNPVLESTEPDFRDPKVRRHISAGHSVWIMTLAVGRRVDFYRSLDLRAWTRCGSYEGPIPAEGVWECPDLLAVTAPDHTQHWFLTIGVIEGGPHGHSGTFVVPGHFDGDTFSATGQATLLDHGPDYYAAQSFWGAPDDACVQMAWLSSWRYAQNHPARGRRGMMSIPRRLSADADGTGPAGRLSAAPYPDLAAAGTLLDQPLWSSEPGRALHIAARGEVEVTITSATGAAAQIRITSTAVTLERFASDGVDLDWYNQTYAAPLHGIGQHQIVIDHGSVEVFAADGSATISALVFAGDRWNVGFAGDGRLSLL